MNNITGMTRQKGEGYANRNYSEVVSNIMSKVIFRIVILFMRGQESNL